MSKCLIGGVLISMSWLASADGLTLMVQSASQQPVANIVVYAERLDTNEQPEAPQQQAKEAQPLAHENAVMDQINSQFVPHILVVERDTLVTFPNSDSIKHHVYSFSPAKSFELKLYDSGQSKPVRFNQQGEVVLGCNIHDWMLGYIYVVDTPWFAKTDANGQAKISLPEGHYQLKIWSPLLQGQDKQFLTTLSIQGNTRHIINLKQDLLPSLSDYENSDELDVY